MTLDVTIKMRFAYIDDATKHIKDMCKLVPATCLIGIEIENSPHLADKASQTLFRQET